MAQVAGRNSDWFFGGVAGGPGTLHRLWVRILELCPALRSEYLQVLVFIVVPLVLFLVVLIVNLGFSRRIMMDHGTVVFRPSLAVGCGWMIAILALLSNLMVGRHQWIVTAANVLALEELVRTFPRRLIVAPEGVSWLNFTGKVSLRWEQISCLSQKSSLFGTEVKLGSDDGQRFVIQSMIFPGWQRIVRRISLNLAQRHLIPSSTSTPSTLERLHRYLAPACLLLVVVGSHFTN